MIELSKMNEIIRILAEKDHCWLDSGHVEREVEYLNLDFHHNARIYPLDSEGNVYFNEYLCLKIYRNRIRFSSGKYGEYEKRLTKLQRKINGLFSQICAR